MFLGKFNLNYFNLCLLILAVCLSVSAQKKAVQKDVLATFQKNIELGKLAETERPLLDFALANPNNVRALELVGRLRFRQGRLDEAQAVYQRVLSLDPGFTSAKINYGLILLETGQAEAAKRILGEINPSEIKDFAALLNLAQTLTLVGEPQKALAVVEKLPVAVKNGEALPIIAACNLALGEKPKIDALIPLAKKMAVAKPAIAVKFANVLLGGEMVSQAIDLLRVITTASPKNVAALILLGKAEIYAKDFVKAKQDLARAAVLEPQSAEVYFTQAMLENAQGNPSAALPVLEKASALAPNSVTILKELAFTAIRASQARKAVEAAEKLLTLKPDEPDFLYFYGAASLQGGNLEKAQTALERFMQIRPNDSRGCLALGLTLAAQRDQIEPARQQLRRCLEINPLNYEAKYQLGLSYKAQGDTATAIKFLEETIALAPNYPLALRDLGTVYLQSGEEQKARTVLEKSVGLSPNDAETHFQLSRLYNLLGEAELAKKHLEMFQKLRNPGGNSM